MSTKTIWKLQLLSNFFENTFRSFCNFLRRQNNGNRNAASMEVFVYLAFIQLLWLWNERTQFEVALQFREVSSIFFCTPRSFMLQSHFNVVQPCFIYQRWLQITLMFHQWIMTETWMSVPWFIHEIWMKIKLMFHPRIMSETWIRIFCFNHKIWMQINLMYYPCFLGLTKMIIIQSSLVKQNAYRLVFFHQRNCITTNFPKSTNLRYFWKVLKNFC